ncbi:argininosuccinate lyase [Halobellus salinus]|uniref:Argininosuccinate lyase n=1 Tax=Halobellus salinus TaxID=931585 RepID=A0A830EEA7_9EURY|nr:argininosuccinate lyase [Halobellus salinus]GGJ17188.1 argininosuccinate lyase [Halobellus salinus]SMP35155.1 argininosuccinate lyase [Halobellus salinus]
MSGEEAGDGAGDDETAESVVRRDRFSGGPARGFLSSLAADERIFGADLAVDRAHVVMLSEQGIVGSEVVGEILAALDDVEAAGHGALPDGEDVHEAIETAVVDRVGPDGGKMHTARSRNDEVAACIRHRLREDLLDAVEATIALRGALLDTAADHVDTVMPGYTHLQPAQPTTVAHLLSSYESAVARDSARLLDAYDRTNRSPLGAAAFAGTPFDIDREQTADLLGFDGVVSNSMDAAAGRDFLAESTAALATHAVTVSGLAEDLAIFAHRGHVDLADEYASTSSIMPQKVNPDSLELVRAVAGDAVGGLSGLLTTLKGLPRAYNRDLQRATPHVWDTVDAVTEAAAVAAGAVETADWPAETLEAAAGEGFSTATGVADALAMAGVPFRTAHEVLATAAERADGDAPGIDTLDAVTAEVLGESLFTYVPRGRVEAIIDPRESVASRDSVGGPAPEAVAAQLDSAAAGIDADAAALSDRRDALDEAAGTLDQEVAARV